ncbi:MAG: hypothetical protein KAR40_11155 [Candidatus Sabulitectum sp.]|nr:hypothetical protein [Candidatus Sabulitectum sp.]
MAYTPATIDDVKAILPTATTLTDPQITAAIAAATCVVARLIVGLGSELSEACQTQVEIYLSAHFAAVTENTLTLTAEKDPTCNSSVTYGFKFGEGIMGTPFGQMANTLSAGTLDQQDKQPAGMRSIGSI